MFKHLQNEHKAYLERYKLALIEMQEDIKRQTSKKWKSITPSSITEFFDYEIAYLNTDLPQLKLLEGLFCLLQRAM